MNRAQRRAGKRSSKLGYAKSFPLAMVSEFQSILTQELMAIRLLADGKGEIEHFNLLSESVFMLDFAARRSNAPGADQVLKACEAAGVVIANMAERYKTHKRLGVTGEEREYLLLFAEVSADAWSRMSASTYARAFDAMAAQKARMAVEAGVEVFA